MAEWPPMHQLLLLRHAKSSWNPADLPDRDRPLNARGRRSAVAMRDAMRDLGLVPDIVLVSAARRTLETLELLEPWAETPLVERMDPLYLANLPQLFAILHGVAETARAVLLIGHNPGLHDLALSLIGPQMLADRAAVHQEPLHSLAQGFPTGGLAEFVIPGPWSRLSDGGGRLVRFLTPRALTGTD
jgi:phosphohistidine phosphatase